MFLCPSAYQRNKSPSMLDSRIRAPCTVLYEPDFTNLFFRHIELLIPKTSCFSRLHFTSISASSSFSVIEHLLLAYGHAWMVQESDVCCTASMCDIQNRCIPYEIDLCCFSFCTVTHKNNWFNKTLMYGRSLFCPKKCPILDKICDVSRRCISKILRVQ